MTGPGGERISLSGSIQQDILAGEQGRASAVITDVTAVGDVTAFDRALFDDGALRITHTSNPPGLSITGDVDEFTYSGLMSALENFTNGPAEIYVDLAGMQYCDFAGLRAIIGLTSVAGRSCGQGTRRVVLHELASHFRAALCIVGWDATPGLVLDVRVSPAETAGGVTADAATSR